jgi:transcriptional regulator with XRE-family HTH domain
MSALAAPLGTALRQLRDQRGWSQELLAEKADLNRSYVGELERGQVLASLLTLEKLARAFGLSTAFLLSHAEQIATSRSLRGVQLTSIAC